RCRPTRYEICIFDDDRPDPGSSVQLWNFVVAAYYNGIMTRSSQPTRLPADVYESAVAAAQAASRTVPQQIAHWARRGREMAPSPTVNHRQLSRGLAGKTSYDLLAEREQAIVRQEWAERTRTLREGLNYEAEFASAGEEYSELDDEGNLVVRRSTSSCLYCTCSQDRTVRENQATPETCCCR